MDQKALTVIAPLRAQDSSSLEGLKTFLRGMGENPETNPQLPLGKSRLIHFCRFIVIDGVDVDTGDQDDPLLAFESNYDGDLDGHLREMIDIGGPALDRIWGHCEGYPDGGVKDYPAFRSFIDQRSIPYEAFYIAYRGQTLEKVRQNTRIRERIEKLLGMDQGASSLPYASIRAEGLKEEPLLPVVKKPFSIDLNRIGLLAGLALLALAVALYQWDPRLDYSLLALLVVFLLYLRLKEIMDPADPPTPFNGSGELVRVEDRIVQNQLTHIVRIKPGPLRFHLLRLVFWGINLLAKICFNKGDLGGIPSIHFARWVILRESRRVLFMSNFDGSWESYLGDFIDKANAGLTGVWSNTLNFPKTWFLVGLFQSGAAYEEEFKGWTRRHQIETQFWYSAHAQESVRNIFNNVAIREGLEGTLSPTEAENWLARF